MIRWLELHVTRCTSRLRCLAKKAESWTNPWNTEAPTLLRVLQQDERSQVRRPPSLSTPPAPLPGEPTLCRLAAEELLEVRPALLVPYEKLAENPRDRH